MWRFWVFLLIGLLAGCQARTSINVEVEPNGSGEISVLIALDEEASKTVPDLEQQLQTTDLEKAGWSIDGSKQESTGKINLSIKHEFANIDQANVLLKQITGEDGPFSSFKLTEDRTFTGIDVVFDGSADLSKGIASFGNTTLQDRYGHVLGFDYEETSKSLGTDWQATFPIDLTVQLPNGEQTTAELSYGKITPIHAEGSATNKWAIVFAVISGVSLVAIISVAVFWKSGKYKPKHRKKSKKMGGGIRARDLLAQSSQSQP